MEFSCCILTVVSSSCLYIYIRTVVYNWWEPSSRGKYILAAGAKCFWVVNVGLA